MSRRPTRRPCPATAAPRPHDGRSVRRPLPLADSGGVGWIGLIDPHTRGNRGPLSIPEFLDYRRSLVSFQSLAATERSSVTLTGRGDARRLTASRVSANLLDVWGLRMLH